MLTMLNRTDGFGEDAAALLPTGRSLERAEIGSAHLFLRQMQSRYIVAWSTCDCGTYLYKYRVYTGIRLEPQAQPDVMRVRL